jgi:VWFA-related protein
MHGPGAMRCVWVLVCAASLLAQDARFDVRSRLVLAPVAVADAFGRPISGLEAADFVVLDNGRPQKIVVDTIDTGVPRIALVVAVQGSGIAEGALAKARKLGSMIQPIVTGDRGCAGLLEFDERVNWLQECTGDSGALRKSFLALKVGEYKTARMLDAVSSAIEHLRKEQNARRVLLLISESRDRGSESTIEQVLAEAQASDVTIYAATFSVFATSLAAKVPVHVTVSKSPNDTPAQQEMHTLNGAPPNKFNPKNPPPEQRVDLKSGIDELARKFGANTTDVLAGGTGGTLFPFTKAKALEEAILKLGNELHSHYVISFAPDPPDEGYHALEFKVTRKGAFQVRARPGYRL